jgi:hypothetical protein
MENNDNVVMSRIAFERMQAKDERNDKWRNIIIILLIVLLVATNAMWLWAWNQYDYVAEDYSVDMNADDGSNANYIGNNGDINNGGKDNSTEKNEQKGSQ